MAPEPASKHLEESNLAPSITYSPTPQPATAPHLLTLPPEIHMHLFETLDIATATCLALTSKRLYSIFKSVHGEKPIRFYCLSEIDNHTNFAFTTLPHLLKKWMEPFVWGGDVHLYRFITPERLQSSSIRAVDSEIMKPVPLLSRLTGSLARMFGKDK